MSKERIEGIKNRIDPNKWRDGLLLNIKEIEWLIEQAETAELFSKKNVELNKFLQGVSSPKNLGRNVVDVAMDMIREQTERVQELEADNYNMDIELEKLYKQNKRYREAFQEIVDSSTNEFAEYIALKELEEMK